MKMMDLFNTGSSTGRDGLLLFLRVSMALLMLVHGLPKLEALLAPGPVEFPGIFGMGAGVSLALAVLAEVVCSVLIMLGLGTRVAAVPLIITMLVAVFHVHGADPFASQELGLHYLIAYVLLLVAGSGKYSADHWLRKRARVQAPAL